MGNVQQAIKAIEKMKNIAIFSHIRPDGDAYGSQLAMGLSLQMLGKKARFFNEDGASYIYQFLKGMDSLEQPKDTPPKNLDGIISVDTSTESRLGNAFKKWNRQVDVNLDHHESNEKFGKLNVIRSDLPSSASLVQKLIEKAKWPMTPEIASCLYVGVSTDTGSFRYRGTTADILRSTARLIDAGADAAELSRLCYQCVSPQKFELTFLAMQTLKLECDKKLAYIYLTPEMFQRSGAKPEDTDGMIEKLQELSTVCVAAAFEFMENVLRVSLRSKGDINVGEIAVEFGGGGHPNASGIRMMGNPEENMQKILERLRQVLEI